MRILVNIWRPLHEKRKILMFKSKNVHLVSHRLWQSWHLTQGLTGPSKKMPDSAPKSLTIAPFPPSFVPYPTPSSHSLIKPREAQADRLLPMDWQNKPPNAPEFEHLTQPVWELKKEPSSECVRIRILGLSADRGPLCSTSYAREPEWHFTWMPPTEWKLELKYTFMKFIFHYGLWKI